MQSSRTPRPNTASPKPFVCNVCKKTYTRSEHLARHYRGHTRERPFVCETCGKDFSRRDLLSRHASVHSVNQRPHKASKNLGKRRTRSACVNCVEAKSRCSDTRPCERCLVKRISCNELSSIAATEPQDFAHADLEEHYAYANRLSNALEPDHNQQQRQDGLHDTHIHPGDTLDQSRLTKGVSMSQSEHTSPVPLPMSNNCDLDATMYSPSTNPFLVVDGGFDDMLMGSFLHDIVDADQSSNPIPGSYAAGLPDVLHVGFDEFADFYSTSISIPPSAPVRAQGAAHYGNETSSVQRAVNAGEQAFKESMWLWDPSKEDDIAVEQIHLTLPGDHSFAEHHLGSIEPRLRLSTTSRDRLLSMVLKTCEPRVQRQVVSCFPSTETLSSLIADFKARHYSQISPWVHFPTLNLDNECEEFLAALICAGAVDSRRPEIRKLGFALQEAARLAIMERFEEDNKHLRDLRSTQTLLLVINVGLNSASRRKIEIAESLTLKIVTMLRRGGRFRNNRDNSLWVIDESKCPNLQMHWKRWVEEESFTRLAYHVLFQDVQTSSALFRQPTLSYSEINLSMPCPELIWQAESDEAWSLEFRSTLGGPMLRPLMLPDCLQDPGLLSLHQAQADIQMSLRAMVSIFWLRVWQFIQMRAFFSSGTGNPNLVTVNHTRQQLLSTGQELAERFSRSVQPMHPCVRMMLELTLMHLYVSLEDIQHLAGKEGQILAREAASRLRSWINLPESRHALLHAGQIAKLAAQCPPQYLRGFHAVVIYHASLIMWTHALLGPSQTSLQTTPVGSFQVVEDVSCMVSIDEIETPELKRFILLGHGIACIRNYSRGERSGLAVDYERMPLTNAAEVMRSMAELLSSRDKIEPYCIPIISYLTRLMRSLAKASAAMKLQR